MCLEKLYGKQNICLDLEIRRCTVENTNSDDQNSRLKAELRNVFVYLLQLKRRVIIVVHLTVKRQGMSTRFTQ